MTTENIFDSRGLLRTDLEISSDRLPQFNALVEVIKIAEAAEDELKIKDAAVAEAVKAHDHAIASRPKWTQHDEWLVMTGKKSNRPLTSPAPLQAIEDALGSARQEVREARQAVAAARATVAKRLAAYNASVPVITPEENVREFIAASNEQRALRVAGLLPPRAYRGGASVVDRTANAMNGGNFRAGGGAAYKRGGVSLAEASRLNAQRARAIAAAKVKA